MIWWVYNQVIKVKEFLEVYVATDDQRIADVCSNYGMKFIMTQSNHPTHVHRIHEVSDNIAADYYVVVCGDEPLISPDIIEAVFLRKMLIIAICMLVVSVDTSQNQQKLLIPQILRL